MKRKDIHTNIMLDLECASVDHPNPILLEIATVHFDLDSGVEYASLSLIVNYQSCKDHGLEESEDTMKWLKRNIPESLEKSMSGGVHLPQALEELSNFVRESCKRTKEEALDRTGRVNERSQPMIWGNGSVADNVWIRSAYHACNKERPWMFYNDGCVRTFVDQCISLTGINFKRSERFTGTRHVALDDVRHQIKYLVKALKALVDGFKTATKARSSEAIEQAQPATSQTPFNSDLPPPWSAPARRAVAVSQQATQQPSTRAEESVLPQDTSVSCPAGAFRSPPPLLAYSSSSFSTNSNNSVVQHGLRTPSDSFSGNQDARDVNSPPQSRALLTPRFAKRRRPSPNEAEQSAHLLTPFGKLNFNSPNTSFSGPEGETATIASEGANTTIPKIPVQTFNLATGTANEVTEPDDLEVLYSRPVKRVQRKLFSKNVGEGVDLEILSSRPVQNPTNQRPPVKEVISLNAPNLSNQQNEMHLNEADFSDDEKVSADLAIENKASGLDLTTAVANQPNFADKKEVPRLAESIRVENDYTILATMDFSSSDEAMLSVLRRRRSTSEISW